MVDYFRRYCPERQKCISYQDTAVHRGTIYKAAGWKIGYVSKARTRDRSLYHVGTRRLYRSSMNGVDVDASEKTRWEMDLDDASSG
jgi:hypothetical protein